MLNKYKRAAVFGVFDGLHPGHCFFLESATGKTEQLIVALALDKVVQQLKNHPPKFNFQERQKAINEFNSLIQVVPGDAILGSWTVLKNYQPEIVFIGHDQQSLAKELKKIGQAFEELPSYLPEKFKSSLLHNYLKYD